MGTICHHAIIVTNWDIGTAQDWRTRAIECGCSVSEVVISPHNGYASFFIAPDGSKEFWPESAAGDAARNSFLSWAKTQKSGRCVLVEYGELSTGENGACVIESFP